MKLLIKNFVKLNFYKAWQTVVFAIFVVLFVSLTAGIVTTPLQLISVSTNINHKTNKWDYDWNVDWSGYSSSFGYEYFEDEKSKVFNDLNHHLLNLEYKPEGSAITLEQELRNYYQGHSDVEKTFNDFVGNFIINNVFSFKYLFRDHSVLIPNDEQKDKTYYFKDIVNQPWLDLCYSNYGQIYNHINSDLARKFGNQVRVDGSFSLNYMWGDFSRTRRQYNLSAINKDETNNVVLNKSQNFDLACLKNNEALINDKFAKNNQIKIGDTLQINNFVNSDGSKTQFNNYYRVAGFATKINNVFSKDIFNQENNSNAFIYLTNDEMDKYINYFYQTDNIVFYPDKKSEYQNQVFIKSRIINLKTGGVDAFFSNLKDFNVLSSDPILTKYNDSPFYKTILFYQINAIIFICLAILILVLSVLFINFCLAKEIESYREQIFILKATGYRSFEISFIWWVRTLTILLLGFWIGWLLSFQIQVLVNKIMVVNANVLINSIWFNPVFILMMLLIIPLFLSLINYLYLWNLISKKSLTSDSQKNVHISSINNKFKQWYINFAGLVTFNKINQHDKLFIVKKTNKSFFLVLIFVLVEILILLEFGSKRFVNTSMDHVNPVYNRRIDSSFALDYQVDWRLDGEKISSDNLAQLDMQVFRYDLSSSLDEVTNNEQTEAIKMLINDYFMIDRNQNSEVVKNELSAVLLRLKNADFNHLSLKLSLLEKFFQAVNTDCLRYFKSDSFEAEYEKVIKLFNQIEDYKNKLVNQDIYFTINNLLVEKDVDYPILKIELKNKVYESNSGKNWRLFLLNEENKGIFNQKINNLTGVTIQNNIIPVIATKHFTRLNHYKVGDVVEVPLSRTSQNSLVGLKILSINDDNVSNNFYASEKVWKDNLTDLARKEFFNEVFTSRTTITKNQKIRTNYFNLIYVPTENQKISFEKLIGQVPISFLSPSTFGSGNFTNFSLEKQTERDKINSFARLMNIVIVISIFLTLILFLVYALVNTNNNLEKIYILKSLGYENFDISSYINSNYSLVLLFSIIIASLISFGIWKLVTELLLTSGAKLVLTSSFNFLDVFLSGLAIGLIFLIGYFVSYFIIKNILQRKESL